MMAKGRGVAKLPPKWKNRSAGNKSPRTAPGFLAEPETSLEKKKKNKKKDLSEQILEFSVTPWTGRIFTAPLGQWETQDSVRCYNLAGSA